MAQACLKKGLHRLTRRKYLDISTVGETKLSRCLSTFDLTFLGVGSTLGAGIYVVAGQVARDTAGPSVILSFLIAAVASIFAGLCYAEFGARVPRTGSAYVYSYVTVGELWAFIIGWNLVLEYVIGTASVARAWSEYFDSMIGYKISRFFNDTMPMNVPTLSEYPDFFALGITLVLTSILAIGVKESSMVNNIFTGVNLLVVAYVVICGFFKADFHRWNLPPTENPKTQGGFFPYGISGTLSGAATCFYAFVGFDCIATTGEEVRNPQKAIPISIVVSLFICFLGYFSISGILTLMVPFYLIDEAAPVPGVFTQVGWEVAKYVISVGAVCALSTSLLGAMFPMPRVIYAMASDGLLFSFLANVNDCCKTPVNATIVSGILAGTMAMLFDLKELVNMMSIGTLLAYTLVAACVLILRYRPVPFKMEVTPDKEVAPQSVDLTKYDQPGMSEDSTELLDDHMRRTLRDHLQEMFAPTLSESNEYSANLVKVIVCLLGVVTISEAALLAQGMDYIQDLAWWAITILVLLLAIIIVMVIIIWRQPQNSDYVTFKVPLVPLIAPLSIFINVYLMMKLNYLTWIRFGVWLAIGFLIYFGYGIWHSKEEVRDKQAADGIVPTSPRRVHTENTTLIH